MKTDTKNKSPSSYSFWLILVLLIIVRGLIISPYHIPSGSLLPTLMVGDTVVVSKFSYGFSRYSLLFGAYIPYFSGRIFQLREVERGEVVVFADPRNPKGDFIVKRIVGLPGDTVAMENGRLFINGKAVEVAPVLENYRAFEGEGDVAVGSIFSEKIPVRPGKSREHLILRKDLLGESDMNNTITYTVPPGHYFGMGDNRDGSGDSRRELGFIPKDYLIGPALFIFHSHDPEISWWKPWLWPFHLRYSRFFLGIA